MNSPTLSGNDRNIFCWLVLCATTIFAMILLGGLTRLTHSGLSMVEWQPLMGTFPPLGESAWQEVFAKYQQYPEYQQINQGMGLDEFKFIFLFEYAHRLLGRLIGICFLLPFGYFLARGMVSSDLKPKLAITFVLGGLQGLLGWYMVKSGLVDIPHVSQYRLTAHLGVAVIIYGYILWIAFGLLPSANGWLRTSIPGTRKFAYILTGLVFLVTLSGGLVAGTRAGLVYGTFPSMGDAFFPDGLYEMTPFWLSIFEDVTTIQLNHRMLAYLLIILVSTFAVTALRQQCSRLLRNALYALLILLFLQILLGIGLLLFMVPTTLALLHQAIAICLFSVMVFICSSWGCQSQLC